MTFLVVLALGATGAVGCGGDDGGGGGGGSKGLADPSPKQFEKARQIGRDLCTDPAIDPQHAKRDPVGYAEEQFGGPDAFDDARVEGCIDALTD